MTDDLSVATSAMTRSEERLHVVTRQVPTGRAVLRKTVVVEERTVTVQVRHEEAHLEIVPLEEDETFDGDHGSAHLALPEFVLHREEVVVTTRVVPVERVRLEITPVTEHREITAELRKERITVDDGTGADPTDLDAASPARP